MRQERGKPDRLKMLKSHAQFALMFSLEDLFCAVDDFCESFEPQWKQQLLELIYKEKLKDSEAEEDEVLGCGELQLSPDKQ